MEPVNVGMPVPEGWEEVTYAKDQPEYRPLPSLRDPRDPQGRILTRWTFTPEEREAIAAGADLYLQVLTFRQSLMPLLPIVGECAAVELLPTPAVKEV